MSIPKLEAVRFPFCVREWNLQLGCIVVTCPCSARDWGQLPFSFATGLNEPDVMQQLTRWSLLLCSDPVGVVACLEMHVAVVQHAGEVAEITDRPQTLQLLSHAALFPTAIASRHLYGTSREEGRKEGKFRNTQWTHTRSTCV